MDSSIDTIPFNILSRKKIKLEEYKETLLSEQSPARNPLQQLVVHDAASAKKVYDILWDKLDPLPKELIQLILSYLAFQIRYEPTRAIQDVYLRESLIALPGDHCAAIKENQICVIDCTTGATIQRIKPPPSNNKLNALLGITDNGILLATLRPIHHKNRLALYNYLTKAWQLSEQNPDQLVQLSNNRIALAEEGKQHITLMQTDDKSLQKSPQLLITKKPILNAAKASQQPELLAVLTEDTYKENSIELYDLKTNKLLQKFGTGNHKALIALANNLLITINSNAGHKDELTIWDSSTGQPIRNIEFKDVALNHIFNIVKTPDNLLIIIPGAITTASKTAGSVFLINPKTGDLVQKLEPQTSVHSACATSNFIVTMGTFGMIQIWKKITENTTKS
jgi:WD40 repeat protein